MSNKPINEPPDLAYAMHSPCGMGHRSEFRNAASKTVHDLTLSNEILFNLRASVPDFDSLEDNYADFHGFAHFLAPTSALVDPVTESMKRFIYAPQYQGDMDGEFLVRAVHRCLARIREKKSPFGYKTDINREVIRGFIEMEFEKEAREEKWVKRRNDGHKAAFFLAPKLYSTPFEVRYKLGFEDDQIHFMAEKQAWREDWKDKIRDGDFFTVERRVKSRRNLANPERHTYRDAIDIKDSGYAIMIDRIAGVIDHFQDVVWGAKSEESVTKHLTGADVLRALLATNEIPENPYFEQQFGL